MSAGVPAARGRRAPLAAAWLSGALALLPPARLSAQDESTRDELWPELDAYVALSGESRLFLLAALARNRDLDDREKYEEHRVVLQATGRFTGPLRSVLVNRGRADLRHLDGEWSWRYRNRTRLERDLALGLALNLYF